MKLRQLFTIVGLTLLACSQAAQADSIDNANNAIAREADAIAAEARANRQAIINEDARIDADRAAEQAQKFAEYSAAEAAARAQRKAAYDKKCQEAYEAQAIRNAWPANWDEDRTIIAWLNARGISQVNPMLIDKIRAYLQANDMHHVAELDLQ